MAIGLMGRLARMIGGVLFAALAMIAAPAAATATPATLAYERALSAVAARLPTTAGTGVAVGFEDRAMRADLRALDEAALLMGTEAFPATDIPGYIRHCAPLISVLGAYLGDPGGGAPAVRAVRNEQRFADELAMIADIQLRCIAVYAPTFRQFWDSLPANERTPVRLAGLRQARAGMVTVIEGMTMALVSPTMSAQNRARFARSLGQWGPALVSNMTLAQRDQLRPIVMLRTAQIGSADREASAWLGAALIGQECTGLCPL